ncbi:MAG: hypothetical protein KDD10_29060 [Phaeodactylibacter sp.]|nr:hypothetical protein [Phaeodactylibacter sp.]
MRILRAEYFDKGSPGLAGIRQAKRYTVENYLNAINRYPRFWKSVRSNTYKAEALAGELQGGIEKLRAIYPELRPAKIYFTIGALRSNGTTVDNLVLIGSELALADEGTATEEFQENMQGLRTFFDSNPIEDVVLLNVHEYVHTQQKPMVHNLLSQSLYEGVAEFVSVTAMGVPSAAPAIEYGKSNDAVRAKFEQEMFYGNNRHEWLWSSAPNDFGVRDLGYYIGYAICERYYEAAADKKAAIQTMIELDYENEPEIEAFVDGTGFFSQPLARLYEDFEAQRPTVTALAPFANGSQEVPPGPTTLTVTFSEPLNGYNTGIDFGPLGEDHIPQIGPERAWGDDGRSWSFTANLEPGRRYQVLISNNFRTGGGAPLKPYLIDFRVGE